MLLKSAPFELYKAQHSAVGQHWKSVNNHKEDMVLVEFY
jgi:hypothetical protein